MLNSTGDVLSYTVAADGIVEVESRLSQVSFFFTHNPQVLALIFIEGITTARVRCEFMLSGLDKQITILNSPIIFIRDPIVII